MGLPNELHPLQLAASSGGYEIDQSLRFNVADGHYLNRTPSTDGNRRTFTYSGWHKFVGMPDASNNRRIFSARSANTDSGWFSFHMRPDTDNRLEIQLWNHSVNVDNRIRDFSAWYHLVLAVDTTQATATDRIKIYINGVQATYTNNSGSGISGFSQNLELAVNDNASIHNIGTLNNTTTSDSIMPMYAAEIYFVDGTQLDATSFGEFDDNGVWRPISVSGLTYGTNGFHLDFSNSSNLGEDQAGSNDWTANSFTTSGTGTDVFSDTPTNNYATFNPLSTRGATATYSEGNLKSVPNQYNQSRTTIPLASGKFYAEATFDNFSSGSFGGEEAFAIQPTSIAQGTVSNHNSGILGVHKGTGDNFVIKWQGTVIGSAGATQSGVSWTNLTIGLAVNFDDQEISGYWNDSLVVGPVDISTYLDTYDQWIFATTTHGALPTITFNAGQRAFTYTPPTGYKALNTSNLSAPTIKDGSKNFNTILWTGDNASSRSHTGVGFQPDWVWFKRRNQAANHTLYDAVRGTTKALQSSLPDAEVTLTNGLTSFDTDGFTTGVYENANAITYVAWNWKANGAGSSNTDGSITSTVSANPSAGFSIVSFTGTGTGSDTVGHGLGVAPKIVILKDRDNAEQWPFYHTLVDGSLDYMHLNLTDANANSGWNVPTSTVFSASGIAGNGDNVIAYCFAEVEGYSKFGSYTGNGSSDGPFVATSFSPSWVMIKNATSASTNWTIIDSARSTYNPAEAYLKPNASQTETNLLDIDMLSNGFKLRGTSGGDHNQSGNTYIFMALAENPFGGSGVSPATAR